MKQDDCIFCKIAAGEIPSQTIHEDEKFRVILDLGPATRGHALILPKEHYANLYEMPDELAGDAIQLAKKMITKMTGKLQCQGFNVIQNNGKAAEQTVFHFHMHLIPRYDGEENIFKYTPGKPSQEELAELAKLLSE